MKNLFFLLSLMLLAALPQQLSAANPQAGLYYSINSAKNPFMAMGTQGRTITGGILASLNNFTREPTHPSFQWELRSAGDGWYYLKMIDQNLYLRLVYAGVGLGYRAQLYRYSNTDAYKFRIVNAGGKYSYIIPKIDSRKRLGLRDGGTLVGTEIVMQSPSSDRSQQWQFIPVNKMRTARVVLQSIKCLQVNDPGKEVEIFGTIYTSPVHDRTAIAEGTHLFNRPAKACIDLRRDQEYPVGSSYTIDLDNKILGGGDIYFDLIIDLFEHDGSSGNEAFEFGDHWRLSDGFNQLKTVRMEVEGTILLVNWMVQVE
ncbi:MAG: hypothetical protein R2824_07435 [Saprospiraceae bacterium]|nr:RICIN domain-containing protein [Lewinella sp.]